MRSLSFVAALAIPAQLLLGQQSPATSGHALSLDDAIRAAQQNNPAYLETKNLVRSADATMRTAYGALLPTASVGLSGAYTQGGTQYFQGIPIGNSFTTYTSNYRLNLNYNLGAAIAFSPRAARANQAVADANVTSNAASLRSSVTQQYIQALEQQATAAANDTLVQSAQVSLDLANAKMEVGAGTILDVRNAEVAVGQAQVTALQAHTQARIAKLTLFQLMGVAPDTGAVLTTQFAITNPPSSLDSLIQLARRVNPDIAAKKSTEFADQMQVRVAQSNYLPSLSLGTGLGGNGSSYADVDAYLAAPQNAGLTPAQAATIRSNNSALRFVSAPISFSAGLSLPLFNGFQREANIEQAQVNRDNASYDLKARESQLVTDVSTAYLNLQTARTTVDMQQKNAEAATQALEFAEESYKVGSKTFLDVAQARGAYEQAIVARVNAIYEYHKDYAALEAAVGRPLR